MFRIVGNKTSYLISFPKVHRKTGIKSVSDCIVGRNLGEKITRAVLQIPPHNSFASILPLKFEIVKSYCTHIIDMSKFKPETVEENSSSTIGLLEGVKPTPSQCRCAGSFPARELKLMN